MEDAQLIGKNPQRLDLAAREVPALSITPIRPFAAGGGD